ncbi:hypothetical protein PPTG_16373 [Phytophthora nicotianae INRA-310]|uniref:MULE transposase domain-containing protein n=1 Tax=Phytophthora nicotianae (strain INRA-310) TaxID=761204 RepID=W2PTL6_PHYN3|nr:hypothetical protein PPTG_16373 [Phytophthora nicotianae INRA-310]ETN03350.1 hypothetical protein PPTG_16373 [Phytophthora nicotianae INRA-310]
MTDLDATFKLNTRGFPVIAVGVSNLWRQFHLVCILLVSDLKQTQWEHAIRSMLDMYVTVTDEQVHISYVMMDADTAQRSDFESITVQCLDVESQPKYMMCFFHVMKNVKKRITYLSESKKRIGFRHIYRIHYARDGVEKKQCTKEAIADWNKDCDLKEFGSYFLEQWLTGRFWQRVETPMGMAKTNSPVENFNGQFKQ